MAGGFLARFLGGTPRHPPEVAEALAELTALARERPALAALTGLLSHALPDFAAGAKPEAAPVISAERAAAKLAEGVPLLRGEVVPLDVPAFRLRWLNLCDAVRRHQPGAAATDLGNALRQKQIDPQVLLDDLLSGRADAVHTRADALGLDAGLTATVLRLSLFPFLMHASAALAPTRQGLGWEHGHCPVCGSWPLLGEFRGLEQTRFLRCGWCAAGWEFPRLRCPFCGETDHHSLGYFQVAEEEGKYRAATCDACGGYVKMVATLAALTPPRLLVADAATVHLDLAAAERGYTAGPVSG